jgi:SsrA-binding protein
MAKRRKKRELPPVEKYGDGVVARNKRASFDYDLGERIEAGLVLAGTEVKMLRQGHADLSGSYCNVSRGEAWVHGINIPELAGSPWTHTPKRSRKLLLHAHEIEQLSRAVERQGMTAIPTLLYFRGGKAKLEIAMARGKKHYDKRGAERERELDRETRQ